MPRDPELWVGFKTSAGVEYIGRPSSRHAAAVTWGGDWYLRAGRDRDGVQLFRRPYFWERKWRGLASDRLKG